MRLTTSTLLWLVCSAASSPTLRHFLRQDIAPNPMTDPDTWCATADTDDPATIDTIWNGWGVNLNMDIVLADIYDPPNANWLHKLYSQAYPESGITQLDGCDTIGDTCTIALNCTDMAIRGFGSAYYQISAAVRMNGHITAIHEMLQDNVTDAALSINEIVADFSPPAPVGIENALSWLGNAAYLAGGIAGAASIFFPPAAIIGATAYLLGGAVNTLDKTIASGTATSTGDIGPMLDQLFMGIRDTLSTYLTLATGGAGDYTQLPQVGTIMGYPARSPIAGFFANGLWLFGSDLFAQSTQGMLGNIKKKVVDLALQAEGFQVLADPFYDSDGCSGLYGGQWLAYVEDGLCFRLYRNSPSSNQKCDVNQLSTGTGWLCPTIIAAPNDIYDTLQNKYSFNIYDYYHAAWDCAANGDPSSTTDGFNLPTDGSAPKCFYTIPTQKVTFDDPDEVDLLPTYTKF